MVKNESTLAYIKATRAYIEQYGKPGAFYSDKDGVLRNAKAKGSVERANATFQDRLVNATRLEGI